LAEGLRVGITVVIFRFEKVAGVQADTSITQMIIIQMVLMAVYFAVSILLSNDSPAFYVTKNWAIVIVQMHATLW